MNPNRIEPTLLLTLSFLLLFLAGRSQQQISISKAAFKTMRLQGSADFLAADGDDVWVVNIDRVEKLSVNSNTPLLTVHVPDACGALVSGFQSVWVASCRERSVYRIDHISGKVLAVIPCGVSDASGEMSLAAGDSSIWILSDSAGILTRIDPGTNRVQATIQVMPGSYCAAYGYHAIWITNTLAGSVQRIDPKTNSVVATIKAGGTPRFLAAGEKGVWVLNQQDGTVSRIDPASNKKIAVINTQVKGTGGDIAAGNGYVWVRAKGYLLQKINPLSNAIETRYYPAAGSGAVRTTDHFVWVTAHDRQIIWILKR